MDPDDELFKASIAKTSPKKKRKKVQKANHSYTKQKRRMRCSNRSIKSNKSLKVSKRPYENWITTIKSNNFGLDQTLDPTKIPEYM